MALRYWVGGTANWDGTAGTKWALTSGGAGGQAVPTSADDVFFDAASGAGVVTVSSTASCLTINFTNYTGTFTISNGITLTVFGTAITLGSGMTYTQGTTGVLNTNGNQAAITITFAGITIPNLTIGRSTAGGVQTVTISGTTPTIQNLVCSNTASNAIVTLAGTALTITSSYAMNTAGTLNGVTPTLTGTVTLTQTGGVIATGFTVSTGSTLIIGSNITISGNITFAAGSFLTPGSFIVNISVGSNLDSAAVTWSNLTISGAGGSTTLITDLNISGNLFINITGFSIGFTGTTTRTINVQGNFTGAVYYGRAIVFSNIIVNLIGTGTFAVPILQGSPNPVVVNINTSNPTGYVIGSASFTAGNYMQLQSLTFNLVGTSVASAFSGTPLYLNGVTIDTNRSALVGGSNPIYQSITVLAGGVTIVTDTTCTGDLTFSTGVSSVTANGAKILFGGNLIGSLAFITTGTSTLEFTGSNSATWGSGVYRNNINVNKSGGAVVTAGSAITYGVANAVLTLNTTVNFSTNSNTFTLAGTPNTINNSSASQFFNMTVPSTGVLNINNATTPITGTLSILGSATFAGTFGWTCGTLTCSTASSTITLQQAITYTTTTSVIMLGTNAGRIVMASSSGSIRAIWTLSQGASQSIAYVNGTRIDSSLGQTVWSFGVLAADISTTLNWGVGVRPTPYGYILFN